MATAQRIAFVCPRFAEGATVGGAETLLREQALRAAAAGREVTFLATCATDHFTWNNVLPPGRRTVRGLDVEFFPVDEDRDVKTFLRAQEAISRGKQVSDDEAAAWLRNSVTSRALCDYLAAHGDAFDRIVAGPYLFGLVYFAARIHPARTVLVPCLHDEPFAYLAPFRDLFRSVHGFMFNTAPERDLARRLYGDDLPRAAVVGLGLAPFEADPAAFAERHGLTQPYVIYCGRREPLKGTPLLLDYMAAFRERSGRDVGIVLTGSGTVDPPPSLAAGVMDLGFVPEQEKREAMAGALAFCHPSVNESLGIVALESWLARAPVLAHAGSEVLRYQCEQSRGGLWFRTYPEFEEELNLLLDDPALRRELGQRGRRYVLEQYGWDAVEPRLLAALDA